MTVNKITNAPTNPEIISKINEIIDNLGGSSTDVQINSTSITSSGVANILTNSAYNASSNKIATMSDIPASELFVATYGTTSYADILTAYNAGKEIFCDWQFGSGTTNPLQTSTFQWYQDVFYFYFLLGTSQYIANVSSSGWGYNSVPLETTSNKTTSLSGSSTDTQYPSAKAVWDNTLHSVTYNSSTQTLTIA